jgi:hypothetical protein
MQNSTEMSARKQYRLHPEDLKVLREAQTRFGLSSEADAVRMAIELLRNFISFADQGLDLAVIGRDQSIKALQMTGLRLQFIPQTRPLSIHFERDEKVRGERQNECLETVEQP